MYSGTYQGVRAKINGGQTGPDFVARITINGNVITLHKGFDVWKEGDDYYIGICSDLEAKMYVYKLDKKEGDFRLVETHAGLKKNYVVTDSGDDRVRLVGYGKRKMVWCAYGLTSAYWIEDFDKGYSADERNLGKLVAGSINDGLWDPVARKESMYFVPNYPTTEVLANHLYSVFLEAHIYYDHPYYCSVYWVGRYEGWACKDFKFTGIPMNVIFTPKYMGYATAPVTILQYEGAWTKSLIVVPSTRISYNYGTVIIGAQFDQGANIRTIGGTSTFNNLTFVDHSYTLTYNWCEPGAKIVKLSDWQFDIAGIAVKTEENAFIGQAGGDSLRQQDCVLGNTWAEVITGDGAIIGHKWKAILLHGIDHDGYDAGPIIVYDQGLIKTTSGKTLLPEADKMRAFFQN